MSRSFPSLAAAAPIGLVAIGLVALALLARPVPAAARVGVSSSPFAHPSFTPAPVPGAMPSVAAEPLSPGAVLPAAPPAPGPGSFGGGIAGSAVTGFGAGGMAHAPGTPVDPGYDILGNRGMR